MALLCISNGHGEDSIAVQISAGVETVTPAPGTGGYAHCRRGRNFFKKAGIALVGPAQTLPSGGFIYMDQRQAMKDLRSGLLPLTRQQLATVRQWAQNGGDIPGCGRLFRAPPPFAWWSGANYSFIGTAKSEYWLRNEAGPLPQRPWYEGWSGSVYLPWGAVADEPSQMSGRICAGSIDGRASAAVAHPSPV